MKWKVCHWLEHAGNTGGFFSSDLQRCLNIECFVCFLNLRGSWITNYKTKTTWCLFLPFMEDKMNPGKQTSLQSLSSSHPLPLYPPPFHISTMRHPIGRCPHRDICGDWCRSAGMSGNSEMVTKSNGDTKRQGCCEHLWIYQHFIYSTYNTVQV